MNFLKSISSLTSGASSTNTTRRRVISEHVQAELRRANILLSRIETSALIEEKRKGMDELIECIKNQPDIVSNHYKSQTVIQCNSFFVIHEPSTGFIHN